MKLTKQLLMALIKETIDDIPTVDQKPRSDLQTQDVMLSKGQGDTAATLAELGRQAREVLKGKPREWLDLSNKLKIAKNDEEKLTLYKSAIAGAT